MGNFLPSSKKLARAVAHTALEHLQPEQQIIEIGPGLGTFTNELRKGIDPKRRLHLIENNPVFFKKLKEKFPNENHYLAGFETLTDLWASPTPKLIISSLPWLSLPQSVVDQGITVLAKELIDHPNSILIQYTYGMIDPIPFNEPEVLDIPTRFIFLNFPPARIWLYKKKPV